MSAAASLLLQQDLEPVPGYVLLKRLGGGGFGEVWKARGPGSIEVALKFIKLDSNAGTSERRALEIIRSIRHPNLLTPFAAWSLENALILGMELADRTLFDRLLEAQEQGLTGIPRDELHEYMTAAALGLDHLNERKHKLGDKQQVGVQHRDVKPQNILLVGGGIKVADFGLARVLEESRGPHSGATTFAYAAPEFFKNELFEHSDQYSLAITYYELRTGKLPFEAKNVFALVQQHLNKPPDLSLLPQDEQSVLARALAKEPTERWPGCRAFVEALRPAKSAEAHARLFASSSTGMRFVLIPAGYFLLSSSSWSMEIQSAETAQEHRIEIAKPFYLGIYQVTQEEFSRVMGRNPSWFCRDGGGKGSVKGKDTRRFSVENVSWEDALEFCHRLSLLDGRQYRLPTEAQWEYAYRAGVTSRCGVSTLDAKEADKPDASAQPTEVGSKPPNLWGLHDMHGNVWEWCRDPYEGLDMSAQNTERTDTKASSLEGSRGRVLRGGPWRINPGSIQSTAHVQSVPVLRGLNAGIRVCLLLD